jgi:phosphatidylglycerol:prolipoprotein diacylglycerol transferase
MIPWFQYTIFNIGPIGIHVWGTLVAIAFMVAAYIAERRAKAKKLDGNKVWDIAFWVFVSSMIGARLFHVVFYDFNWYLIHPWDVIDPTKPGYAIAGGLIFGALAVWIYVKVKKLDFFAYADAIAWSLPWGLGIGRIGCFLIHDHPGVLTSLPIGVRFPDGGVRHDLGLEESLLGFGIGLVFLALNRSFRNPPKGYWVGLFMLMYGVARFFLDFLRVADLRVASLTPTQWLMVPVAAAGAYLVFRRHLDKTAKMA